MRLFSVIDLVWADYQGIEADVELNCFTSPTRFFHNLQMLLENRKFGLTSCKESLIRNKSSCGYEIWD